ncbi:MAG: hypothetical protein COA88_03420 [Kordia sp.]|nr:MAG: hypothetical protein COA88_03420 [Kordia sp.]
MRTYIFFISLLLSLVTFAQEEVSKDSTKTYKFGLRVGTDISKLVKTAVIKDYTAFEINADYKFTKKYSLAGEFGNEKRTIDETQINFTTEGSYFKIGVDYNAYKNWLDMENAIFVGLRYGLSSYKNTLNSYTVFNPDTYWGENGLKTEPINYNSSTTHFVEFIIGVKAEIFNNLYLGINAQLKNYVGNKNPDNFENLYIPGFGKTTDDSKWGVSFGYTVSYFIPFYKK